MLSIARDLAIIVIAIETFVALGVVILLVWKVYGLIGTVQKELPGLIASARRTAQTVEGTASFVGRSAAMPIIRVASAAAAASKFTQVLLGTDKPKRR